MCFKNWFLLTFLIFFLLPGTLLAKEKVQLKIIYDGSEGREDIFEDIITEDILLRKIEDAQSFAKESNIDKNSKWFKKIRYRLEREKEFDKNLYSEKNVLFKIESKDELKDINFANTKPITTPTPITINLTKEEQEKFSKEMEKEVEEFYTPPKIPPCKKSEKEIIPNPISDKIKIDEEKEGYIYFDSLLLSKNILKSIQKKDILNKDFFGRKNNLEFYSNTPYDMFSFSLRKKGIKCLPLRVIVTKNTITKYYGEDALKNYDLKKEGEFHWKVKKNIDRFFDLKKR